MRAQSGSQLSKAVRAEAAVWVARLHSSGRTRAVETGLRDWLKADRDHARAFEIATEAWELGGSIPAAATPRMTDPFDRRVPGRWGRSLAAVLSALAIGALFLLQSTDPAVTTRIGEQRMLTLRDGTRIFLNTDTRLFVHEDEAERRVRLDAGEALFDVATDPARPFVVTVGEKEVVALGTSFVVRRDEARLSVTLVEGKVAVSPVAVTRVEASGGPPRAAPEGGAVLVPGQRLTFVAGEPPRFDEPMMETVTAWRRGEVILDNTRLADAVAEMNRYSAVKLIIDDVATAAIRVSGIFRVGDSVRFAQAVAETYGLDIEHQPNRILILDSNGSRSR